MNLNLDKPHANNTLATLPLEDQQRILDWKATHSFEQTVRWAALPRPEGLDLKTSVGALFRFCNRTRPEDLVEIRRQTQDLAESLARSGSERSPQLQPVLLETLEEKALRELLDPDQTLSNQAHLANTIIRLATLKQQAKKAAQKDQDLELRRQARELAAQRFTFQSIHLLRQNFPFPDQVDLDVESRDIGTVTRLLQLILTGASNSTPAQTPVTVSAPNADFTTTVPVVATATPEPMNPEP